MGSSEGGSSLRRLFRVAVGSALTTVEIGPFEAVSGWEHMKRLSDLAYPLCTSNARDNPPQPRR